MKAALSPEMSQNSRNCMDSIKLKVHPSKTGKKTSIQMIEPAVTIERQPKEEIPSIKKHQSKSINQDRKGVSQSDSRKWGCSNKGAGFSKRLS